MKLENDFTNDLFRFRERQNHLLGRIWAIAPPNQKEWQLKLLIWVLNIDIWWNVKVSIGTAESWRYGEYCCCEIEELTVRRAKGTEFTGRRSTFEELNSLWVAELEHIRELEEKLMSGPVRVGGRRAREIVGKNHECINGSSLPAIRN